VRLFIEMQDGGEVDLLTIPPSDIPGWLKKKIETEQKI
jgi:hypothetical protein